VNDTVRYRLARQQRMICVSTQTDSTHRILQTGLWQNCALKIDVLNGELPMVKLPLG